MRSNLPFFSAGSNANLKSDGILKEKMRLVQDVKKAVCEKRRAFASARGSDEDH